MQRNFESNILNKVFCFLWTKQKSQNYLKNILKNDEQVKIYYEYINLIRKYSKRYLNKYYLKDLCNFGENHFAYGQLTKNINKLKCLDMK
jgi:hypothetical protein